MLGKGSKDQTILPQTPCGTTLLHLVVPSATLPPTSPDPAGIAPEKHTQTNTHTTKIKINEDCDSLFGAMHFCVGEKDSSPVGGAPVLPATSPDAFDPPHGPTTSGMRRG